MTGMPLRKIDFISSVLALAEPVPFTVAILMTKSLTWAAEDGDISTSGDLRFLRLHACGFVFCLRPADIGFLHVPRRRRAALRAKAAVDAQILVFHHDTPRLRQPCRYEQRLC